MGRRRPEPPPGFLDKSATAKELDVSIDTVTALVRRGALVPHFFGQRRYPFFRIPDLHELSLARRDSTNLQAVRAMALQALSAARRTETRVDELCAQLGIDHIILQRDESSLRTLLQEAQQDFETARVRDAGWVRYWSSCFFAMDELYLELAETVTGVKDAWKIYLDLANRLAKALVEEQDDGLLLVSRYLASAQRHLVHVSYLHCRRMGSGRVGKVVFDGRASAVDELSALLF